MSHIWHGGAAALAGVVLLASVRPAHALSFAEAVEMTAPTAVASPSPRKSPGDLPPLLPPEGLPTAPPPDAIKPVVPQAQGGAPEAGA